MGFNKRKMEDRRRETAEKEAAARRATDRQILEDAEQLVTAWNERQAKRMPMLFSPTRMLVQVERGRRVLRGAQRQQVGERVGRREAAGHG
jgi:hypothetical protein